VLCCQKLFFNAQHDRPDRETLSNGGETILIEYALKLIRYICRIAMLDVATLHHVDQLTFAKQRERRRGGPISREVAAGAFRGLDVLSCENREYPIRLGPMLQGCTNCRTHAASG